VRSGAGIAGTFNAPVGGALFAVEIILGDFGVAQFSPIVISSVAATVVSQHFLGDFPAFVVPRYQHASAQELFIFAVFGILAGFTALGFVRTLYKVEDWFDRIRAVLPVKAMLGGACIGVIGLGFPQVFGVGYEAIEDALDGGMLWYFMLLLVAVKIVAVSVTIGSGGSGGVFAPSLFIGAMLGGAVGSLAHSLWPAHTTTAGAYALAGMGAVVAAGTHAPITAIIIIFEMTNDYKIILPLMITCIIATLLSTRLQSSSIYTLKLLRRGVDIHRGRAVNVLTAIKVRDVMKRDPATVSPRDGLGKVLSRFVEHAGTTLFVIEDDRTLKGVITIDELRPILKSQGTLEGLLIAQDVMVWGDHPTVSSGDSLADVMRHLGTYRGEVPVVEDGRLAGVIWPKDVIDTYNTEVFKRDMARSMASAIAPASRPEPVPTVADTVVTEMPVPHRFVGKSIQELEVRRKYGVSILMVKRNTGGDQTVEASPDATYVFQPDDVMLIMGSQESLETLRR
jgi:CIC family chloride channel protein